MGLSGPRKRQKISHDPNNTHWSSNITTFGQRILASQGWTPGQTLGRKDASHAAHFTKASASHVRVALREDNLGIGAKPGSGQGPGECTGLDSFQDLLGRLNGKSEATIEKERGGRAAANRIVYADRKYGGWSRFVSAGYLVGDDVMVDQLDNASSMDAQKELRVPGKTVDRVVVVPVKDSIKSDKKAKKRKTKDDALARSSLYSITKTEDDNLDERARRKAEKAQHRAAKAQRKENRAKRREERALAKSNNGPSSTTEDKVASSQPSSMPPSRSSASGSATPVFTGGRHAVRHRYIMQKKAAMLDAKALNEILMVKV